MHIKFMAHGTGSGRDAAAYLLADKDHKHEQRAGVEVLRGNPEQLGQLIDSLHFVQRYTSGVIAFAPEDKPNRDDVDKLLTDFEKTAFAGLEGNQYAWAAVRHDEPDGGCHVHVIAARVDLQSGKSLNIAPPGWENTFDHLRDAWNYEKGWARPDDPLRARLITPTVTDIRSPKAATESKMKINEWLESQMAAGLIRDRNDVLEALKGIGNIHRCSPDSISLRLDGAEKSLKFKGAIYAEQFSVSAILENQRTAGKGQGRDSNSDREAAKGARRELQKAIERRAQYNQSRYGRPLHRDQPSIGLSEKTDTQSLSSALRGISELVPFDRVRSLRVELVDDRSSTAESDRRTSGGGGHPERNGRPNEEILQHASGQSELHWEQEVDEPNRKPKPKTKRQLDRERADDILEAIGRFAAGSRANLDGIRAGAEQRAHANERPTEANQYVGRICEAVRRLADGVNKSFEHAREFIREAGAEMTRQKASIAAELERRILQNSKTDTTQKTKTSNDYSNGMES